MGELDDLLAVESLLVHVGNVVVDDRGHDVGNSPSDISTVNRITSPDSCGAKLSSTAAMFSIPSNDSTIRAVSSG